MMRLLACLLAVSYLLVAQSKKYSDAEVQKIHRSLLLIDTHNDITSRTVQGFDIGRAGSDTHTDLPRMKLGNLGGQFFAVYVAAGYVGRGKAAQRALEMIDTVRHDIAARYPQDFALATSADQILAARAQNKIAVLMGIEGGHAIEDNLRLLRAFYDLGVRYMTLTHANHNNWADSSGPEQPRHNGLTTFGRGVVAEMNRIGMMVDVSHVSDKTFWDVLEVSKAPVFASHSSCRALSNIPRNMSDEMIRAMAKKGGVIQINFGCEFLSQKSADSSPWSNPKLARLDGKRQAPVRATLADVVAHIDHVVKIAGIGAVGLGSDFDGVQCVPEGLEDVSKFPNLTRALLEKGYAPADIAKIYGENLLRLMRAVERVAGRHP